MRNNLTETEFVTKVNETVDNHMGITGFGVKELAQHMGYSREYVSRKIKITCQMTASEFIMRKRLSKGARLLCTRPDLNVTQIAMEVGFDSHAYFSKCFRVCFGKTPTEWRAACSGNGNGKGH